MQNLDEILRMFDGVNDETTQACDVEGASVSRFMFEHARRLIQNAEEALAQKSDAELEPYLTELLERAAGNGYGSWSITQRLKAFSGDKLREPYLQFVARAKAMNSEAGLEQLERLSLLLDNEELKAGLTIEQLKTVQKHFNTWAWWWHDEKWKKVNDIDEIMDMLSRDNSGEVQKRGVELGKKIESLNVFLRPRHWKGCEGVWENCAEILTGKSDKVLYPYLSELLEWIKDLNWPGALTILNRLKTFSGVMLRDRVVGAIDDTVAQSNEKDSIWLQHLSELLFNEELKSELPKDKLEILQKHRSYS